MLQSVPFRAGGSLPGGCHAGYPIGVTNTDVTLFLIAGHTPRTWKGDQRSP
jgi:hypothetical protein